jgi:hypothetical protein
VFECQLLPLTNFYLALAAKVRFPPLVSNAALENRVCFGPERTLVLLAASGMFGWPLHCKTFLR